MKLCSTCRVEKTLDEFHRSKNSSDGHMRVCRLCNNAKSSAWRQQHPASGRRAVQKWASTHREQVTRKARSYREKPEYRAQHDKWRLQREYGLTFEKVSITFAQQNGRCKICQEMKKLEIDHCHVTGQFRGLLCGNCNRGLGLFKDKKETLDAAIAYLGGIS